MFKSEYCLLLPLYKLLRLATLVIAKWQMFKLMFGLLLTPKEDKI